MKVEITLNTGSKQTYENVDHISSTQSTTILSSSNKTIATIFNESFKSITTEPDIVSSCNKCINFSQYLKPPS